MRESSHPTPPSLTGRTENSLDVLIVDDDEIMCARIAALLEADGNGTLHVASLNEAKQALIAVYFPILIVDRMLGDGDGMDLCRELRALRPDSRVYIMMLSSLDSEADVQAGLRAGADDYVSKRAPDHVLRARLRAASAAMHLPPKV